MYKGFSIEIQHGLSEEEKKAAERFANRFIVGTIKCNMYYSKYLNTRAGYSSFLRRGSLGLKIEKELDLYFRRVSRKTRRFAVVKSNTMIEKCTGIFINNLNARCMCPKCQGGTRVSWAKKPETYTYATIGTIRG